MPEFFLADVRKRANSDASMVPQAIPERRVFADEIDAGTASGKAYSQLIELFGSDDEELLDEPVTCTLPGCSGITMEWATGDSFGQIDFYGGGDERAEPERFLSLYVFSGNKASEDRAAMRQLEQYADFAQCLQFPLVLQVTDDPLAAAWQHAALQALRVNVDPLVAAFLKAYFSAENVGDRV
jgi:hypothetical protein